jgi:alpha/beta superfamily hydrolase
MATAPTSERLFLRGPAGKLEAILETPDGEVPVCAAVVLHPHPQHGGTLHNKVAYTLARAFLRSGCAALRFNFRGVEGSQGEFDDGNGELADALAAIEWMRARHAELPVWLSGFSFGAAIAIHAASRAGVRGLVSVAPAMSRIKTGRFAEPVCPWLIVQGDADELVDVDETIGWVNDLDPGPELLVLEGAEHFFHGRLVELRDAVEEFVTRRVGQ